MKKISHAFTPKYLNWGQLIQGENYPIPSLSPSTRNSAIDALKGVGMCLVIYGHTIKGTDFRIFLYSFHMPLFFVISGLFFKPKTYANWRDFLARTGRALLVPYLSFYILSYLYWLGVERIVRPGAALISWYKPLIGLVLATDIHDYMSPNAALWFLVSLFVAQTALYALLQIIHSSQGLLIVLCLSLSIGFWLAKSIDFVLPWSLKSDFIALFFVGLGYLVQNINLVPKHRNQQCAYCLALLGLSYILSIYNGLVDIDYNQYGNPVVFLAAALSGVWGCLCGATLLQQLNSLVYIGTNSLIAFGLSEPVKRVCVVVVAFISHQSISIVRQSPAHSLLVVSLTLLTLVPLIYIFTYPLKKLIGR